MANDMGTPEVKATLGLLEIVNTLDFVGDERSFAGGLQPMAILAAESYDPHAARLLQANQQAVRDYETINAGHGTPSLENTNTLKSTCNTHYIAHDVSDLIHSVGCLATVCNTFLTRDQPMAIYVTKFYRQLLKMTRQFQKTLAMIDVGHMHFQRLIQDDMRTYFTKMRHDSSAPLPTWEKLLPDIAKGRTEWFPSDVVWPHHVYLGPVPSSRPLVPPIQGRLVVPTPVASRGSAAGRGQGGTDSSSASTATGRGNGRNSGSSVVSGLTAGTPRTRNFVRAPAAHLVPAITLWGASNPGPLLTLINERRASHELEPPVRDDGAGQHCLAYHIRGACSSDCGRAYDHGPHTAAESAALLNYCNPRPQA